MVGSVDVLAHDSSINGTMKQWPEDFSSMTIMRDHVTLTIGENGIGNGVVQNGTENGEIRNKREKSGFVWLYENMHGGN